MLMYVELWLAVYMFCVQEAQNFTFLANDHDLPLNPTDSSRDQPNPTKSSSSPAEPNQAQPDVILIVIRIHGSSRMHGSSRHSK